MSEQDGLISSKGSDGGAPEWQSHPNKAEAFNIAASEHFKAIGNLPARKKLNADEGTLTTRTGTDSN